MMMKVKTNKKVNIRAFEPYQRSNNLKGELNAGFEIEVEEVEGQYIEEGEGPNKIASTKWYKDKNGDYYWSGGFGNKTIINIDQSKKYINYNDEFKRIAFEILEKKGKQKKIAIIDSGIEINHPDLKISSDHCFDFSHSNFSYTDKIGHGTHCAGLIGGNAQNQNGVVGIAPLSELFILKSRDEKNKYTELRVSRAIDKAIELNVDIISMSFKLYPDGSDEIKKSVQKAIDKDILVIAAAGNNEVLISNEINFPASLENVLSIGAMDKEYYNENLKFNNCVDFILPLEDYYSLSIESKGYYESLQGCSMATALVAGLASSILHFKKPSELKLDFVKKKLNELSKHISEIQHNPFLILKL